MKVPHITLNFRTFALCLIIVVAVNIPSMGDSVSRHTDQGSRDLLDRLPFSFSTVAEFDASTATFFGRLRKDGSDFFASIDALTGNVSLLGKMPPIGGWMPGASALDPENHRFFLAAYQNKRNSIFTINADTGNIIRSFPLSHPIKTFDYDPSTEQLLGLARIDRKERFVSIDPSTGDVLIRSDLTSVNQTYSGIYFDVGDKNLYFLGIQNGQDKAWAVEPVSGSVRRLSSRSVGLNEHLVHSFKESGAAEALFTAGVQSCIGIAGYAEEMQIGFVAHFAAGFPKIESSLARIDRELRKKYGLRGLKDLRLWVVGGVRDIPASVKSLHSVYRILGQRFGADVDAITKFNTGISYNILINRNKVVVF